MKSTALAVRRNAFGIKAPALAAALTAEDIKPDRELARRVVREAMTEFGRRYVALFGALAGGGAA